MHVVVPSDQTLREWLDESGIPIADSSDGRLPTDDEVRAVLDRLPGYSLEFREEPEEFVVDVSSLPDPSSGPWACLAFPKPSTDPSRDRCLTFRTGWPEVIVTITYELSKRSGPLLLIPDTGDDLLLVHAGADPDALLRSCYG